MRTWLDGQTLRAVVDGSISEWRPVESGIPQGLELGLELLNTFVSGTESVTECISSKYCNDSKLGGLLNTLEGKDAIQRDLDRLARWDWAKLKVQQDQAQGPASGPWQSQVQIKVGWRIDWQYLWWEGLGGVACQVQNGSAMCTCSAERKEMWRKSRGWWLSPSIPFLWDPTWRTASTPENPNIRMWPCWRESRGGPPRPPEGWSTSPSSESLGCSVWEEKVPGTLHWGLPVPKGALQKWWRGTFYKGM